MWPLIESGALLATLTAVGSEADAPRRELADYLRQLGGGAAPEPTPDTVRIVLGTRAALAASPEWAPVAGELPTDAPEAYRIRTLTQAHARLLIVTGNSALALWYAVYELLHILGVRFFFDAVRVPRVTTLAIPALDRNERPTAEMRVFKPQVLGDYSTRHSFWFWNQARWEQAIRWCVQNRLNTIHLMCFAGMNWLPYRDFPEARVTNDPVMTTAERVHMAQALVRYAHGFGLKVWIGFVVNGATYPYVDAHPEQACTGIGGVYEGDLCGRAGRAFLLSAAHAYFETYADADGFVFWPPEGHCLCDDCRSGKSFAELVTAHVQHLRATAPAKRVLLLDWSIPLDGVLLSSDLTMLNMHEFSQLPPYIARGMPTVFDMIVNWDTASCTTVSPRVHDMHAEMLATARMGTRGFEAHLVSAASGELNIQAFAACAWDPVRFDPDAFTAAFLRDYYDTESHDLRAAIAELESVWTPPYNAYTSVFVSRFHHWAVPGDANANCVTEITEYVPQPGAEPVKAHRRLARGPMLDLLDEAVARLDTARRRLAAVAGTAEPLRFLKASVDAQWLYARWIAGKYRTLVLLAEARDQAAVTTASAAFAPARDALLALHALLQAHRDWFETRRCVAERDLEAWIGTQAIQDEVQDRYAASVIGGRCIPTIGLPGLEALLRAAQEAIARGAPPPLVPDPAELEPFVRYPRQRAKIIANMRQRLAAASAALRPGP